MDQAGPRMSSDRLEKEILAWCSCRSACRSMRVLTTPAAAGSTRAAPAPAAAARAAGPGPGAAAAADDAAAPPAAALVLEPSRSGEGASSRRVLQFCGGFFIFCFGSASRPPSPSSSSSSPSVESVASPDSAFASAAFCCRFFAALACRVFSKFSSEGSGHGSASSMHWITGALFGTSIVAA
eukprot:CAMPEP_0179000816 /NCGR_PEP_ID=MMETSP0795-20121207/10932_1 /TAXON_ID=88552 /ORGANISM="Amoebophrya sp., Strain Ameob2" /LENGTH=181 /DNA_ID=CAMNT_0020693955 /DNA_START=324 /DNA_END=870 /DNA_ORIENTATION=+